MPGYPVRGENRFHTGVDSMRAAAPIAVIITVLLVFECVAEAPEIAPGSWLRDVSVTYRAGEASHRGSVHLYFPRDYRPGKAVRTLVLLHGYRQSPGDWELRTPAARYADEYGFVLVCPAMSTTLYESAYYPETVNRWAPVPGSRFVTEVLIPFVRERYGLARKRDLTGVYGISTGARGALLLAARNSDVFGAAAGLSGDYDASSMRRDRILTSVYGRYEDHPERWEGEVNILALAERLRKTPVYLGHGTRDGVVPPQQTDLLARKLGDLRGRGRGYPCEVEREKSEGAGHDWNYWGGLTPGVFAFFDRHLGR